MVAMPGEQFNAVFFLERLDVGRDAGLTDLEGLRR
jgi:hypothetical protein